MESCAESPDVPLGEPWDQSVYTSTVYFTLIIYTYKL